MDSNVSMESKLKDDFDDYTKRINGKLPDSESLSDKTLFYRTESFSNNLTNKENEELSTILKNSKRHKNLYKLRNDFTHPKSHEKLETSFKELDLSIEEARNKRLHSLRKKQADKLEDISSYLTQSARAGAMSLLLLGVSAGSFYLSGNSKEARKHEEYVELQQTIEKVNQSITDKRKEGERWGVENPENNAYFQDFKNSKEGKIDSMLRQKHLKSVSGLESKLDSLKQEKSEFGLVSGIVGLMCGLGSLPAGYAAFNNRSKAKRRREELEDLDPRIEKLKKDGDKNA